ncbi:ORF81 [Ostreid herpesvirus 1]|uniref:Uncharacterized protein ORF81 n=1 Tax=Ostreid herpesvirus 1 (isolate France) TaxID=654903 RepID=Y081_OSHVF|nr:ORF81 [Ostreid herpesvirus 1]Q6R7E8.1 RecName: Full=Uncharacterized protein ORF81 [Ostreid herpesvirus 1 (isolate France)]ADD24807.1 ORF80 [Chlamys acute necrobiotic virus]AAS00967.1 ORF81 [Ostreid herpesvirus 1]AKM21014.1 ORF81 [Ostreid herpesvirus 1]AVQ67854.1 ORF81 [Ostreid herpesvirus 1]UCX57182.1 ORF81 [Ostreid herpesvirus 1]
MAQYTAPEFEELHIHMLCYRLHCDNKDNCELCKAGWEIIRKGTGHMIRDLLSKRDRRLAGSNIIGISLGEMDVFSARKIQEDNTDYNKTAGLINEIETSFPGMNFIKHVGGDLFKRCSQYTPFLKHADELYSTLKTVYNYFIRPTDNVPLDVIFNHITLCCHFSYILVTNPNSIWLLHTIHLTTDNILLINKHSGRNGEWIKWNVCAENSSRS